MKELDPPLLSHTLRGEVMPKVLALDDNPRENRLLGEEYLGSGSARVGFS
jgi:hypothetical protein